MTWFWTIGRRVDDLCDLEAAVEGSSSKVTARRIGSHVTPLQPFVGGAEGQDEAHWPAAARQV